MPKFKKRPIIVDAYQTKDEVTIHTLEGNIELYPCKKSVFEKIYEPINENNE
jgi:hypothetical protein